MPSININLDDPKLSQQDRDQLNRLFHQKQDKENIVGSLKNILGQLTTDYVQLGTTYNLIKESESEKIKEISISYGRVIITYNKNSLNAALEKIEKTRKLVDNQIQVQKRNMQIETKNLREIDNKIVNIINKTRDKKNKIPALDSNFEKRKKIDNDTQKELEPHMKQLIEDCKEFIPDGEQDRITEKLVK